jgi:hypothetical protein
MGVSAIPIHDMASVCTMLHKGVQVHNVPAAILHDTVSIALAKPLQRL